MDYVSCLLGVTVINNDIHDKFDFLSFDVSRNDLVVKILEDLGLCSENEIVSQDLDALN